MMAVRERATKRRKLSSAKNESKPVLGSKATMSMNEDGEVSIQDRLPSVKDFASSDPKLRRENLSEILAHLEVRRAANPLTHTECLQLWRGFHVLLYMHDSKNAISVQNLTATLAETVALFASKDMERKQNTLHAKAGKSNENNNDGEPTEMGDAEDGSPGWLSTYTTAFWETMAREWSGIDSHRMNKYLLLIRLVIREIFTACLRSMLLSGRGDEMEDSVTEQQLGIVETWPLNGKERKVSDGLRLHVLDVWKDELLSAMKAVETEPQDMKKTKAKSQGSRAKSKLKAIEQPEEAPKIFKRPVEKISRGDSGAQRHVRQRAKEVLAELEGNDSDVDS